MTFLEMDGGDDRTTPWMYLKPLNGEHKNDTMAKNPNDPKTRWSKKTRMILWINDSFLYF